MDAYDYFMMIRREDKINSDGGNFITEDTDKWEILDIIPMEWNKLILYNGARYHTSYIKKGWFTDYYRVNQMFFYKPNNIRILENRF